MATEQRRSGFALTEMERRTLFVLALLLLVGLIGKQVKRWGEEGSDVVIQGAPPIVATDVQESEQVALPGDDVSGSLAPSTSPDVPSVLRVSSSGSDPVVDNQQHDVERLPTDSMRVGEITSTLRPEEVRPRVIDVTPDDSTVPAGQRDPQGRIDLNAATSEELESIPGIGAVLAKRVLDWRAQHGSFQRVEDLLLIEGIGDKRLATMKQHVYVQPRN